MQWPPPHAHRLDQFPLLEPGFWLQPEQVLVPDTDSGPGSQSLPDGESPQRQLCTLSGHLQSHLQVADGTGDQPDLFNDRDRDRPGLQHAEPVTQ